MQVQHKNQKHFAQTGEEKKILKIRVMAGSWSLFFFFFFFQVLKPD